MRTISEGFWRQELITVHLTPLETFDLLLFTSRLFGDLRLLRRRDCLKLRASKEWETNRNRMLGQWDEKRTSAEVICPVERASRQWLR
jgi:hypothetical protein